MDIWSSWAKIRVGTYMYMYTEKPFVRITCMYVQVRVHMKRRIIKNEGET